MNSKRRKALLIFIAAILGLGFQALPIGLSGAGNPVYGGTMLINSKIVGSASVMQGDENAVITVQIENKENGNFTFNSAELGMSSQKDITVTANPMGTITLAKDQKASINFSLKIARFATAGTRNLSLILRHDGVTVHENGSLGKLTIYEKLADPIHGSGNNIAALDIIHYTNPAGGFDQGQENILALEIINNGSTVIKKSPVTLTMPDGLSMDNASNSMMLGYIATGSRKEVRFLLRLRMTPNQKATGLQRR
jgi:hypothetical protein